MRTYIFLLLLLSLSCAQFYDIAIVRANDSNITNMVYDDWSFSYRDNSFENPDANLRICATQAGDILNKYVALAYADGSDGDYLLLVPSPLQVTSVPPSLCVYAQLDILSFRAWYPSIPYVFISDTTDMGAAERFKLSRTRGWFIGNYTANVSESGNTVNITVVDAKEDTGASIIPDVNYLVIGIVRDDFTVMDTEISSLNDTVSLLSDAPGAPYNIFINGIGPDMIPYVEIISPEPITYSSGSLPFTYIMYDDDDIYNCWYVLDGTTVNMPACGVAYVLSVEDGTHTLTLYANDTTGNIGSDSVIFTVGAVVPPTPPTGGGPPGTPFYQPPAVPPAPPSLFFSIIPENIYITIDYPNEGSSEFMLTSTASLYNVSCFVRSDFAEYTTVELDAGYIEADGTIEGTVTVDMPPQDILDYDDGTEGVLQCVGQVSPSLSASTLANVYLTINRPVFDVENITSEIVLGEEMELMMEVTNTGAGNATAISVNASFANFPYLFEIYDITRVIEKDGKGYVKFKVRIPSDMESGTYTVPLEVYENNRLLGKGYLSLNVVPPGAVPPVCRVPDLLWTLAILFIGIVLSILRFRKKLEQENRRIETEGITKPKAGKKTKGGGDVG